MRTSYIINICLENGREVENFAAKLLAEHQSGYREQRYIEDAILEVLQMIKERGYAQQDINLILTSIFRVLWWRKDLAFKADVLGSILSVIADLIKEKLFTNISDNERELINFLFVRLAGFARDDSKLLYTLCEVHKNFNKYRKEYSWQHADDYKAFLQRTI